MPKHTDSKANPRLLPLLLAGLTGILLSLYLFFNSYSSEKSRIRADFTRVAGDRISAVAEEFDAYLQTIRQLKAFFDSAANIDRSQFSSFVQPLLWYQSGLRALAWIPVVRDDQRRMYEESARKDGLINFIFTERNDEGSLVRARRRDEYFPVYYIEPITGNEAAVGYDGYSEATPAMAINLSRQTGRITATARVTLVQEVGKQYGTLLFAPVYEKNSAQRLRGFALAVIRLGDALYAAVKSMSPEDVDISVYDTTDAEKPAVLVILPARMKAVTETADTSTRTLKRATESGIMKQIDFAGRQYAIVVAPTPDFISARKSWRPWLVLAAGLLLTGLTVLYLLKSMARTSEIEAQAIAKAELSGKILTAQDNERRRLARELHDGLGQSLLATKLSLQKLEAKAGKGIHLGPEFFSGIISEVSEVIEELRIITMDLRPSFLEDMDLSDIIQWYGRKFYEMSGIAVEIDAAEKVRVDLKVKENFYRILQEAMSNVLKHSDARIVKVILKREDNILVMNIRDRGRGFSVSEKKIKENGTGIGLKTMRERAELLKGTFSIASSPASGTLIEIRVPV